ncbi:PqqD family protein [Brassicibacter mesophilus]|uniref:PqqD family protein n=1 Tax=Brassicibacter mesophilus TaxID=745119 RepID=UPI003D218E97
MGRKNKNFLEMVPRRVEKVKWIVLDNGKVQIVIDRNGFFDKLVRFFAKTPEVMRIDLDEYGSYVWKAIDGEKTTYEICEILKSEFGKDVEPLYERFGTYINILKNNKFIEI